VALLAPALCSLLWVVAPGVVRSEEASSRDDGRNEIERSYLAASASGLGEEGGPAPQHTDPWPVVVFGSEGGRCSVERGGTFEDRAAGIRVSDSRPPDDDALARYRGVDHVEHRVQVRKGDTFAALMDLYDVPRSETYRWHRAARKTFDLSRLTVGHQLSLFFDRGTRTLAALEYAVDRVERIAVDRGADGELRARKATVPTWIEIRGVSGTVGTSITRDCNGAAVPGAVVQALVKLYAGDVNFRKLQRGDRFRVLYEVHVDKDGEIVRNGKILAAEVVTRGKPHVAFYFDDEEGKGGYYDVAGNARGSTGGSANGFYPPLRAALLTSGFSRSRRHPVHGRVRPHHGVDFAAPQGAPVRAIADGRVTYAHWHGQLGRAVRIDHGGSPTYASIYGHLSRIEQDVGRGTWVRKGDVIGYVGRTGSATGPHLHLSVRKDGRYVDPLPVLRFAKPVVARASGPAFEAEKKSLLQELASLDAEGPVRLTRLAMKR
jgi:murein DD-endopeptidase MepM/ murein hydrolase activator NlpD